MFMKMACEGFSHKDFFWPTHSVPEGKRYSLLYASNASFSDVLKCFDLGLFWTQLHLISQGNSCGRLVISYAAEARHNESEKLNCGMQQLASTTLMPKKKKKPWENPPYAVCVMVPLNSIKEPKKWKWWWLMGVSHFVVCFVVFNT